MKKSIKNTIIAVFVTVVMISSFASDVLYLPDVTPEMSVPSYWSTGSELLMDAEEIIKQNQETIAAPKTNMYDLKNQPETVDGIALNDAIERSSNQDVEYYLGWTYLQNDVLATKEDFAPIIENTQNQEAKKEQPVLYGIAVVRTALRAFPSELAIWDDPKDADFDYQYLVGLRINEPVVITSVSKDGKYYLAKNVCCSGWVPAEDVAVCKDKDEWLSAWDIAPENSLVVWGDKVFTEASMYAKETSELMLTMGTVLSLAETPAVDSKIDNRASYHNYVVWAPLRNADGSYAKKQLLLSETKQVNRGYLPMTQENIAKVAFAALGNTYGWGGSLHSEDCSGYLRNVYKCFGLELARNTTWQAAMPMAKLDMQHMCREERELLLKELPFGTILIFNGHEMMYLGTRNDKTYVISAISTIMQPDAPTVYHRVRSTVINTLEIKRGNGNTWQDELIAAVVPYMSVENNTLPAYQWYHDGVTYCLKNGLLQCDENKYFNPEAFITNTEVYAMLGMLETEEEESLITREQLALMFYEHAQKEGLDVSVGEDTNILSYDDAFSVSEEYIPAMQYVVGAGILQGKSISTLAPKDNTKKAEAAMMLKRFTEYNEALAEQKAKTVDYGREISSWMSLPETENATIEALSRIDSCPHGTAGASQGQQYAFAALFTLVNAEAIEKSLAEYFDEMDATQLDYFSFQWQFCMEQALKMLQTPEQYQEAWETVKTALNSSKAPTEAEVKALDVLVTEALRNRGVTDVWQQYSETEPFSLLEN